MAKPKFKTASALGCSDADRDAAIKVLAMLDQDKLVQVSTKTRTVPNGLNMGVWRDEHKCGTVGCIGGWMEKVKGAPLSHGCMQPSWSDLFCPTGWIKHPRKFTIERCAKALRAKLTTGQANWSV